MYIYYSQVYIYDIVLVIEDGVRKLLFDHLSGLMISHVLILIVEIVVILVGK